MMKIISFKICPFVQRVTALLEAKNLPYELEYIQLKNKPQWFLDLSPTGQVPLLVTESGEALFESDAIVEYIEEVTVPLEANVSPEQRAKDRAWSYQASKHYLAQCSTMRSGDEETLIEREEHLAKAFTKVEQELLKSAASRGHLAKGDFFKGEHLSNVDIAWLPLLHRAHIIKQHAGHDFFKTFPRVQKWQQAVMESGLAERSVANDFEQRFTDFYLSEKTYLGGSNLACKTESSCTNDDACATASCC